MAEYAGFFDATDNIPEYTSTEYAQFYDLVSVGIAYGYRNQLEVTQGNGLEAVLDSGGMTSKGRYYIQSEDADGSSPKTLEIDAATAGYMRKDRIVVEFDANNGTVLAKVSKGVEAASAPQANSLIDTATKWEEPLAIVNVEGGTITSIEDDRKIQGARCNTKDFAEDITAPNVTISQGGKIYLGSENDYIYISEGKLMLKIEGCTAVQIATVTVGTDAAAPAGTYPVNTMYLERDA
ncbi:MAG: hypothetical protein AB1Z23_03350 [Eubacteriales bacterium]